MRLKYWVAISFITQVSLTSAASLRVFEGEIRGTINPATDHYLKKIIKQSNEDPESAMVLINLDTPGGLVTSVESMSQTIEKSRVPVAIFVSPAGASATSAGALLMLAAHRAYLAPGTSMGAAHPVDTQGKAAQGEEGKKALNHVVGVAKALADLRKRPNELAAAMVEQSRTFTADEAFKQKLVDGVLSDKNQVIEHILGQTLPESKTVSRVIISVPMSFAEKILNLVANPNIAAILMTLAMLLIYVEVSNPGISIAGGLGVICLILAFMAFQVLPIQTAGAILLGLGLILLLSEAFVATHGALGVSGVASFVLGLIWLFDSKDASMQIHPAVVIGASGILLASALFVGIPAARSRKLAAATRKSMGGFGLLGLDGYVGVVEAVGDDPKMGKCRVRGELWDIESETPLQIGQEVRPVQMNGFKLKVVSR